LHFGLFVENSTQKIHFILAQLNDLQCLPSGVFASSEPDNRVTYSDGDTEEEYIYQAVTQAKDLSSLSDDLLRYERDWASECHLSSKRANVFRALDFSGMERILEIGSGCGAITRFLGEQGGEVHAVEGSLRRAEITRKRCRDLDNVEVVCSNFNNLKLPGTYYNLAILTGVLEYAGKYGKSGENPIEAAVSMIRRILDCLGPDGKLIVAIENRIGFKYLAGASEDHFSRPWVGLCQYPECEEPQYKEKQGIETWDKSQWNEILHHFQDISSHWYYPFPDYKLATTLLSEHFFQTTPQVASCLARVKSRDYTALWRPLLDEQLFWQTVGDAGMAEEMANSFVVVLEKNKATKNNLVPFDFVHFAGQSRKPAYRLMIQKKKGVQEVEKKHLSEDPCPSDGKVVTQHLKTEPYLEGELLQSCWQRSLRACASPAMMDNLLKEYYSYLVTICQKIDPSEVLDLLPMNIMVSEDGIWTHFDQEWHAVDRITVPFIFFRAVLYFYWENKEILVEFCKKNSLSSGWEFVDYCLGRTIYSSDIDLEGFVLLENKIQKAISRTDSFVSIERLLDSVPKPVDPTWTWEQASLVWGQPAEISPPVTARQTEFGTSLFFSLPQEVSSSAFIQLHMGVPEQEVGKVFKVQSFTLFGIQADGTRVCLFPQESNPSVPPLIELTAVSFFEDIRGGVYTIDDRDPQVLHFALPENLKGTAYESFECVIALEFLSLTAHEIRKEKYLLEKQKMEIALAESMELVHEKTKEVINRDNLISEKTGEIISRDKQIEEQIRAIHSLNDRVEEQRHRLKEIEESKAWRLIFKLRKLTSFLHKPAPREFLEEEGEESGSFESTGDAAETVRENRGIIKTLASKAVGCSSEVTKQKTKKNFSSEAECSFSGENRTITIIIASYDTIPAYLQESLQSIFSQSFANWEIILVDSGSTHGPTLQELGQIHHPKIKIHHVRKAENLTSAMNDGVQLASGEWIIFLGHTDRLVSDALKILVHEFNKQESEVFYWDERVIDRSGISLDIVQKKAWNNEDIEQHDMVGSSLCVHRKLFEQIGLLDPLFDGVAFFEFVLRAGKKETGVGYVSEILSEKRIFAPPGKDEQRQQLDLIQRAVNKFRD